MSRAEIEEKVNNYLLEEMELEEALLKPEARIKEDLKIDSLDYVDIGVMVSEVFDIKVKQEEMKILNTLADFYDFIDKKVNQ